MRAIHSYGSIPKSLRSTSSLSSRDDSPRVSVSVSQSQPQSQQKTYPLGVLAKHHSSSQQKVTQTTATTSASCNGNCSGNWNGSRRFFSLAGLFLAAFFLASAMAILYSDAQNEDSLMLKGSTGAAAASPFASASINNSLHRLGQNGNNNNKASISSTQSEDTITIVATPDHHNDASWNVLSHRGQSIQAVRNDIDLFMHASANAYHPTNNPQGYLNMIVAENRLMQTELAQKLVQVTANATTSFPLWTLDYGDMTGQHDLKVVLADMMQSTWMQPVPVDPSALVVQAGAGSILDSLAWTLANAGDAVLTTGPAYAAFAADFHTHGQVVLYVATTPDQHNNNNTINNYYEPTVENLEQTYQRALQEGHVPRILILCQPHNPTGTVYSAETMQQIMTWALDKTSPPMHIVSDEIYGNSVFPGVRVTSAAHIMYDKWVNKNNNSNSSNDDDDDSNNRTNSFLGDRVHIVAGLSKDWGMSGFRIGTLFTHNAALQQALSLTSYYDSVSQYTQWAVTQLFWGPPNRQWALDYYVPENKRRLYETFLALQDALALVNVTVNPDTQGGIFAWVDASSLLQLPPPSLPEELDDPNGPITLQQQQQTISITEQELWMDLYENAQILWTLGESFYEEKPGMFRIVYAWPTGGVLAMQEMRQRLVQWNAQRRQKWEERQQQQQQ